MVVRNGPVVDAPVLMLPTVCALVELVPSAQSRNAAMVDPPSDFSANTLPPDEQVEQYALISVTNQSSYGGTIQLHASADDAPVEVAAPAEYFASKPFEP
jgi:hypothetical protein